MKNQISANPTKVPRLDSLHHQLQTARDADGNPMPLGDDLLFFLEDPPPGTGNRWQAGADFCAEHGIVTSRTSVWRFYRSQIIQWRREQNPPPPEPAPDALEIERLEAHARYLAAQRAIEMLNDPKLTPAQLVGIMRQQNQGQQIEIARDTYYERVAIRLRREKIEDRKERKEMVEKIENAEQMMNLADNFRASIIRQIESGNIPPKGGLRSPTEGAKGKAPAATSKTPPPTPNGTTSNHTV